jgi:hypothetical protein
MSPRKAATVAATKSAPKSSADRASKARPAKSVAKSVAKPVAEPAAKPAAKSAANGSASAEASALAARIERDLRDGRSDSLTPQAFQALMAALCKSYGTQLEAGAQFLPLASQTSASPTEVMTTTSALLKAANLAVFELGMWQSWTGR